MTDSKQTEISQLGEFGLIAHLTDDIEIKNESTIKGIGDDAAVIDCKEELTLVSTDLLVENVHFNLIYTPLKHLGYKSAVVNISDMAAMNATPKQITVSIAVSNRISVEALEELYTGIKMACDKYNVDIVGGDTTSSYSGLVISITIIGVAKKEEIVYRSGAKPSDLICVSGDLGAAYMGLLALEREKEVFNVNPNMQPDFKSKEYILQRQLKPEAKTEMKKTFAELGFFPNAMIDVSDGVASDILHICKSSDVGCKLYEDKLPIDFETVNACEEFNIDPTIAALNGGEDYELLFTIDQKYYEKIKNIKNISIIGHITNADEGYQLISRSGQAISLTAQGWDAFLRK